MRRLPEIHRNQYTDEHGRRLCSSRRFCKCLLLPLVDGPLQPVITHSGRTMRREHALLLKFLMYLYKNDNGQCVSFTDLANYLLNRHINY